MIIGELQIESDQRKVYLRGNLLSLTRIQYELLCLLAINKDKAVGCEELLTTVWGPEYKDEKQYLWVNMSRLRCKMEATPEKTRYIHIQRGVGYVLRSPNGSNIK
jgi:two-component system KDP operon response regulator KdpE